jgi:hypothetical protein
MTGTTPGLDFVTTLDDLAFVQGAYTASSSFTIRAIPGVTVSAFLTTALATAMLSFP